MKRKKVDLRKLRTDYNADLLDEKSVPQEPMSLFRMWMHDAVLNHQHEPNAMCLSTCSKEGQPRGRMLLLKGIEKGGFTFFTNYESEKAIELGTNAKASLTFYWQANARQVRVDGTVKKLTRKENVSYFSSRPRLSQIGAWASHQSAVINDRSELEDWFGFYKDKFRGKKVPCPMYWGGYVLIPDQIEFWQGRMSRLHDRVVYKKSNRVWKIQRVSP